MTTNRTPPAGPPWLYPVDIAEALHLHPKTVVARIRNGTLPGVCFGNQVRVSPVLWEQFRRGEWQPKPKSEPMKPVELVHRKSA